MKRSILLPSLIALAVSLISGCGGGGNKGAIPPNQIDPVVSLSVSTSKIFVGGDNAVVTASLSRVINQEVIVSLRFSGSVAQDDYTKSGNIITIPSGQKQGFINLHAIKSSTGASTRIIAIDVDTVTNAKEDGEQKVTVEIVDSDTVYQVTIKGQFPDANRAFYFISKVEAAAINIDSSEGVRINCSIDETQKLVMGVINISQAIKAVKIEVFDTSSDVVYTGEADVAMNTPAVEMPLSSVIFADRTDWGSEPTSPNGRFYAKESISHGERKIEICQKSDNQLIVQFKAVSTGDTWGLKTMAWTPNSQYLALMYHSGEGSGVHLYDAVTGDHIKKLAPATDGKGGYHWMVFSRDSRWLYLSNVSEKGAIMAAYSAN